MKHSFFFVIVVAMMLSTTLSAQWEAGVGFTYQSFNDDEFKEFDAIKFYNFAARQSGGKELPDLQLSSKNILTPSVFVKYALAEAPLTVGVEVLMKGFNLAAFAEYEYLIHDGNFSVFARPRVSVGWNSRFPVSPDWKQFLGDKLPDLTASEIEEGAALFAELSPSSIGIPLSVLLVPQVDVEWQSPIDIISVRGSFRYNLDLMKILSKRSQDGFIATVSVLTQFGG